MDNESTLNLAADIISAHVSNNSIATDQLPGLIRSVYDALAGLGKVEDAPKEKHEPAVSIRSSVKPDAITCLECGARMKMLKRHLNTNHSLTPAEYKARWSLSSDYPMVAPEYSAKRKELAVRTGLGRKPDAKVARAAGKPAATRAPRGAAAAKS